MSQQEVIEIDVLGGKKGGRGRKEGKEGKKEGRGRRKEEESGCNIESNTVIFPYLNL